MQWRRHTREHLSTRHKLNWCHCRTCLLRSQTHSVIILGHPEPFSCPLMMERRCSARILPHRHSRLDLWEFGLIIAKGGRVTGQKEPSQSEPNSGGSQQWSAAKGWYLVIETTTCTGTDWQTNQMQQKASFLAVFFFLLSRYDALSCPFTVALAVQGPGTPTSLSCTSQMSFKDELQR